MAAYPARVLVLRKTKLRETDTILTLLAEDGRQIRAVAKGLRKPGGRFGGRLEPYAVADLLLHTGRSLDVISEAATVTTHAPLREDFDRNSAAAVVVDLLDKISVEGQPEAKLFALATTTLDVMQEAPAESLPALVVAFLAKAMAMHGYRPELDVCASCASELGESRLFSAAAGGAVCSACGADDASAVRFGAEGRAWLGGLLGARMAEVPTLEMPAEAVADCFALMRAFIAYHVATRLRALDFYATLVFSAR
jgi:DNA repair protein RecO (recombination protein O)